MFKNIIIILAIIGAVIFSQQPMFKDWGKKTYSWIGAKVEPYTSPADVWLKNNIYPKISGEVDQKKQLISQEITTQKNNILETTGEKIKNYFSNLIDSVFNKDATVKSTSSISDSLNSENSNISPAVQKCIETCQK